MYVYVLVDTVYILSNPSPAHERKVESQKQLRSAQQHYHAHINMNTKKPIVLPFTHICTNIAQHLAVTVAI